MAKRKQPKKPATSRPRADAGATLAIAALCVVLAGSSLAVDTMAAAAFDAPKRLIALCGTALAAAAVFAGSLQRSGRLREILREGPRARRAALWLGLAALVGGWIAALASPRRGIALDTMRSATLLALLVPLGASRVLPRGRVWLCAAFLGACAINSVVAILESRGVYSPFALQTFGARQDTGAFAGNVGYLAIALALASVLTLGILVTCRSRRLRVLCVVALALYAAGLVVNQNLTALSALLIGTTVLLVLRFRTRAGRPLAAAVAVVALAVIAYAPLRLRAGELTRAVQTGNWDALVSFRGGPWAAALEMTRERPWTGFGPGTFPAEYVPHRLAAEIRLRRRLVSPLATSSYAEAHSDYLQTFSDAGLPAGLVTIAAGACLLAAVVGTARRRATPEAIVLAAVLATGAAAALTWFPFQRPITAAPLLLAAGRAWRISAEPPMEDEPE